MDPVADICTFEWSDGWGHHLCHLAKDHKEDHRCVCDQTERRRDQA